VWSGFLATIVDVLSGSGLCWCGRFGPAAADHGWLRL
jgi:hypothetical protein